jgi:hypothetical protein
MTCHVTIDCMSHAMHYVFNDGLRKWLILPSLYRKEIDFESIIVLPLLPYNLSYMLPDVVSSL